VWRFGDLYAGGVIMGDMLGVLLGVKSNVGGVGIAMILLICARLWMQNAAA
jgi:malonate transporter MadL subunit